MPDKWYMDLKTKEKVELLSDQLECGLCGSVKFKYKRNEEYLPGGSELPWKQICSGCGNIVCVEKQMKDPKRYVLLEEWEKKQN
jgi:hypothetical protein